MRVPERITCTLEGREVGLGSDWRADMRVGGGYGQFSGTLYGSALRGADQTDEVILWREDGSILYVGELPAPPKLNSIPGGAWASVAAEGLASRLRDIDRSLVWMKWGTKEWGDATAEPYNFTKTDDFQIDRDDSGVVIFRKTSASNANVGQSATGGIVLHVPSSPIRPWIARRIAFTAIIPEDGALNLKRATLGGALGGVIQSWSDTDSGDIDFDIPIDGTDTLIVLHLGGSFQAQAGLNATISITNSRVGFMALTDDYETFRVMQDVAALAGLNGSRIQATGTNMMPLEWHSSLDQLADFACLLDDRWWMVVRDHRTPTRNDLVTGGWLDRIYRASEETEVLDNLQPLPVANRIVLGYSLPGREVGDVIVDSFPDPLASRGRKVERRIDIGEWPDSDFPEYVGSILARQIARRARAGNLRVRAMRGMGRTLNGYDLQPGVSLRLEHLVKEATEPQRVVSVSYGPSEVADASIEVDDSLARMVESQKVSSARAPVTVPRRGTHA